MNSAIDIKEYIDKCQNTEKCLISTVVVMLRQCESQLIRAARISSTPHHWLQLSTETHSPGAELQNTSTYIHFSCSSEVSRVVHPNLVMMLNLESVSSVIAFSEMESAREGRPCTS